MNSLYSILPLSLTLLIDYLTPLRTLPIPSKVFHYIARSSTNPIKYDEHIAEISKMFNNLENIYKDQQPNLILSTVRKD